MMQSRITETPSSTNQCTRGGGGYRGSEEEIANSISLELPSNLGREKLRKKIVIVKLECLQVRLGMTLRIQVILVELVHPAEHLHITVVHKMPVSPMFVRRIE